MMTAREGRQPWVWDELGSASTPEHDEPVEAREVEASEEERLEEAYRRGFNEGRAEGRRDMEAEVETALMALSAAARRFEEVRTSVLEDLEDNTAALAVAIARELVVGELDRAPDTVLELVREAVSSFALGEPLRVRLHPADLALISAGGGGAAAGSRSVAWEPDPGLPRGGCLVEGPGKIVDGRLDLALERIYQAITHG